MNRWLFALLLFAYALNSAAADCTQYKDKIRKLEDLRRHGGSLKQMDRWRMQTDEVSEKLNRCNREGSIQIVSGQTSDSSRHHPAQHRAGKSQKLRQTNSEDPQIQQLVSTCNYWITEFKTNPSMANSSFKDTACRALDAKLSDKGQPVPVPSVVRSLSECIKPNNLIDNDVQECRQGIREPIWKRE
jgi:hypothetical protein